MKYIYKLNKQEFFKTNIKDKNFENEWLRINKDGAMSVNINYSWNGCTPKFDFLNFMIGTPEGKYIDYNRPITWRASLIHDCLYQFKRDIKITRKEADLIFYHELKLTSCLCFSKDE